MLSQRKDSQFWKYLLDYSALSKRRPRKKVRGSSCLQVRSRRKEEADTESSVGDFKNAWTGTNRTAKRCEASLSCFLSVNCIKQIDSKLPSGCSVIDHRRRQIAVRTSVTHSPPTRVVLFTFWRHLWSITEQAHGNLGSIYFKNRQWVEKVMPGVTYS